MRTRTCMIRLALAGLLLLPAACSGGSTVSPDPQEDTVIPDDVTELVLYQRFPDTYDGPAGGLDAVLIDSDGQVASLQLSSDVEEVGETRIEAGRRMVVGYWEVEIRELDDTLAVLWIRDHDRDPNEPVGLRLPGGGRNYPPGFVVEIKALDDDAARLEVMVRTDPSAPGAAGWEVVDATLPVGETIEVHGYRVTWHDRHEDELFVRIERPDGTPIVLPFEG
jgi:hypothetical protein